MRANQTAKYTIGYFVSEARAQGVTVFFDNNRVKKAATLDKLLKLKTPLIFEKDTTIHCNGRPPFFDGSVPQYLKNVAGELIFTITNYWDEFGVIVHQGIMQYLN